MAVDSSGVLLSATQRADSIRIYRDGGEHWMERYAYSTVTFVSRIPAEVPGSFSLLQNYPNPFNPSTIIRYTLPEAAQVSMNIYNICGQQVASLAAGFQTAGTKNIRFDGTSLPSGVYFCRLTALPAGGSGAGNYTAAMKMVLIR